MNRYHIKIGFEAGHISQLKNLTEQLNLKNWLYSEHCLDNLKYRFLDLKGILLFIKGVELRAEHIFEYYEENGKIIKLCYRINYNSLQDIIIVLTPEKKIVTIYLNSNNDSHLTLKKELYNIALTK